MKCVRLDSVISKLKIDFDFIKIDTQGADFQVIKSLGEYLDTQIIAIQTELFYTELYKGITLFKDVDEFLKGHGFTKRKRVEPRKDEVWNNFLYVKKDDKKKRQIRLIKQIYNVE